jgi:hypothetical protein
MNHEEGLPCLYSFHLVATDLKPKLSTLERGRVLDSCPVGHLPEDLYWYISDTWTWIPTHGGLLSRVPFEKPIIAADGAKAAHRVFSAWAELFAAGPAELELTGPRIRSSTVPAREGTRLQLRFNRDTVVAQFRRIAKLGAIVMAGGHILCWSDLNYMGDTTEHRRDAIPL